MGRTLGGPYSLIITVTGRSASSITDCVTLPNSTFPVGLRLRPLIAHRDTVCVYLPRHGQYLLGPIAMFPALRHRHPRRFEPFLGDLDTPWELGLVIEVRRVDRFSFPGHFELLEDVQYHGLHVVAGVHEVCLSPRPVRLAVRCRRREQVRGTCPRLEHDGH